MISAQQNGYAFFIAFIDCDKERRLLQMVSRIDIRFLLCLRKTRKMNS